MPDIQFLDEPAVSEDVTQREAGLSALGALLHELQRAVVPVPETPRLDLQGEQTDGSRGVIRIERQRLPGRRF